MSVGEVNLLAPVIQLLRSRRPDWDIVLSTTTETGFDLATQKYSDLPVFFFPLDFSWAIKSAFQRTKPSLIVLSELELWPNFIRLANRFTVPNADRQNAQPSTGIPIVVVNGRLSESSYRGYRRLGSLMTGAFAGLRMVMAQNATYAQRFRSLGCPDSRVVVTGNVKFDGLETDRQNEKSRQLARLAGVQPDEAVFVAGSTQFEEDIVAARAYQQLVARHRQLRLVLVPRHPERVPPLVRALNQLGLSVQLRSQLGEENTVRNFGVEKSVLVVDVIGELSAWWGVADAAYVGGSMGSRGGQNMIEPAAYGIPVAFGPNTQNFQEIVSQLLVENAAMVVQDLNDLTDFVGRVLDDSTWALQIGSRAQNLVLQHDGASERTVSYICGILHPNAAIAHHSAA